MSDDLYGIRQAVKAGFDKELAGITPTEKRFDGFNGVNYGRYSYVNLNANRGFVNVAGHELYHSLEKERHRTTIRTKAGQAASDLRTLAQQSGQAVALQHLIIRVMYLPSSYWLEPR